MHIMTREEKFENKIICCDTCRFKKKKDKENLYCMHKLECFMEPIGGVEKMVEINGEIWQAKFYNSYDYWETTIPKTYSLPEDLFEI